MAKYTLNDGKGDISIGATIHTQASVAAAGGYFEAEPAEVAGLIESGVVSGYNSKPVTPKAPEETEEERTARLAAESDAERIAGEGKKTAAVPKPVTPKA